MFSLIKITDLAAANAFLLGIPESVELLIFGIGLVVAVVMLRWFLDRGEVKKTDEKFSEEA